MATTKSFFKSSFIYFIGNVSSKIIGFFMLPLYTELINPSDYGTYDLMIQVATIAVSVIFFEMWVGVMRFMYDYKDMEERPKVVSNGLVLYCSSLVFYSIVFVIIANIVDIKYISYVFVYGILLGLDNFYCLTARGYGKNKIFVISGVVSTIITVIFNIIFIVYLKYDYSALFISSIIAYICKLILLEIYVKVIRNFKLKHVNKNTLKRMLLFSLPLAINAVAFWFLTYFNRVIIVSVLGADQNGFYAVGSKFAVAITLISSCIQFAWQDKVFASGNEEVQDYTYSANLYIKFLTLGSLALIPVIFIIFPIMIDAAYAPAISIMPTFIVATVFSVFSVFIGQIFAAIKKTNIVFISTLVSAIINVATIYLLINRIGLEAANIGLLAGYFVNIVLRLIILKKYVILNINWKYLIFIYLPLLVVTYVVYYKTNLLFNILLFVLVIGVTLLVTKNDIKAIFKSLKEKK